MTEICAHIDSKEGFFFLRSVSLPTNTSDRPTTMVENCGYIDNEEGFFSSDQSLSLPGNTSESFYNNDREAVAVCQQRRMIHLLRSISESIWIYFCVVQRR